jgi:uncharacterized protein with von Willebrand factor type A (vWA) domain
MDKDSLRAALAQALLDGDDDALRRLARMAVAALGRADVPGGRPAHYAYRVLRDMAAQTLIAGLLDQMLGRDKDDDTPADPFAEEVARRTLRDRIADFEQHVRDETRRLLAEERGREHVARTGVPKAPENLDFLRVGPEELATLRRQVQPLARRLATRLGAKRRHGNDGRLDFRRTVRSSLATGGVPVNTYFKPRRPHRPELVVLCDVSGSVASFAHFTLLLAWVLQEQFSKVRAFAFIDTTDEVTGFLKGNVDLPDAMQRMNREATLVTRDGHSDYGHSLDGFVANWSDAMTPRTTLLVLGDGRTNYSDPRLATVKHIVGSVKHAWWLNPEARGLWGTGDSSAKRYADVMPMVECRNVTQLEQFVTTLLPTPH